MHLLSTVVRRFLEAGLLLLGGLAVLASCWLAVFTITSPGCAVDSDDAGGVLAVRMTSGGWIASELICLVLVVVAFRRTPPDDGWSRIVLAAALPLGAFVVWLVWGGATALILDLLGAGAGSSACF